MMEIKPGLIGGIKAPKVRPMGLRGWWCPFPKGANTPNLFAHRGDSKGATLYKGGLSPL